MNFTKPSKRPRGKIVKAYTLPAPVKGLNTRDPLAAMEAEYAIELTNYVCTPQGVETRRGYREWVTGLPGYVIGMIAYRTNVPANNKVFALSGGGIYDVTAYGTVGAPLVSGLVGAEMRHTNFQGSGGQYVVICNGIDPIYHYDGMNWVQWSNVVTPAVPGQIAGVNPEALVSVITHQRRLWFVETGSSKAWYLPVNSIGGQAYSFDFGPLFPRGGRLQALCSWSIDGGTGMQNQLVAVSEFGDAVVYEGTDPSSAADWRLAGAWRLAPPASRNCFFNMGGDALYLSMDGLMPLTRYLTSGDALTALTDTIRPTITELIAINGDLPGWQIHDCPRENLIIINVPQSDQAQFLQLVYNTVTNGWSLFTGIPAQAWVSFAGSEFFGGNGVVYEGFFGFRDGVTYTGEGGTAYLASSQQAFTYFENRSKNKRFTMARLNLLSSTTDPRVQLGVNTDFNVTTYDTVSSSSPTSISAWNTANWNAATWQGSLANINEWQSVSGIGYCGSITVTLSVNSDTTWVASDIIFEEGGLIG